MKIAITGATGLLGRNIINVFREQHPDWELVGLTRHPLPKELGVEWKALDIGDTESTYNTITKINPDLVIHCAAVSKPDACAKDPEAAMRTNFLGTRNVALACLRFDAELMFISSDQVFYGCGDKVHEEYDAPKSTNLYGQTKILGERFIRDHLQRFWIVRTAKIFGGPADTHSFLHFAHNTLSENKTLKVVKDWAAHTTHGVHLAEGLAKILCKKTYGIYHVVSPGVPSYVEIGEFLADAMGVPRKLLSPILQKDLGLPVLRASYVEISTALWRLDFGQDLPSWKEGVKIFVSERAKVR